MGSLTSTHPLWCQWYNYYIILYIIIPLYNFLAVLEQKKKQSQWDWCQNKKPAVYVFL